MSERWAVAVLFPGQGSQYVGMGRDFSERWPVARRTYEEASAAIGWDVGRLCFEGRLSELSRMNVLLPAILTTSVASFRVLREQYQLEPTWLAGHSLGEYSALVCAGVLSLGDACRLVKARAELAQKVSDEQRASMMIVEGVDADAVGALCRDVSSRDNHAAVSCFNGNNQVTLSGHENALQEVQDRLTGRARSVTPLFNGVPFHCELAAPVAEALHGLLEDTVIRPARWPIIANVDALPYRSAADAIDRLVRQITQPVQWVRTMDFIERSNVTLLVETAPRSILTGLWPRSSKAVRIAFDSWSDHDVLEKLLRGNHPDPVAAAPSGRAVLGRLLGLAASVPNCMAGPDVYAKQILDPVRRLEGFRDHATEQPLEDGRLAEAVSLLAGILDAKGTDRSSQRSYVRGLLCATYGGVPPSVHDFVEGLRPTN